MSLRQAHSLSEDAVISLTPCVRGGHRDTLHFWLRPESQGPTGSQASSKSKGPWHPESCLLDRRASASSRLTSCGSASLSLVPRVCARLRVTTAGADAHRGEILFTSQKLGRDFFFFPFLKDLPRGLLTCFQGVAKMWSLAHLSPHQSQDPGKTPQDPSHSRHEDLRSRGTHAVVYPQSQVKVGTRSNSTEAGRVTWAFATVSWAGTSSGAMPTSPHTLHTHMGQRLASLHSKMWMVPVFPSDHTTTKASLGFGPRSSDGPPVTLSVQPHDCLMAEP